MEVGAAIKGARLLAAGIEVAGLTGFDVGLTAAKGVWDLGLGLTGITGNAAFQATDEGREIAWLRGMAFMATMGYGLAASKIPALRLSRLGGAGADGEIPVTPDTVTPDRQPVGDLAPKGDIPHEDPNAGQPAAHEDPAVKTVSEEKPTVAKPVPAEVKPLINAPGATQVKPNVAE